MLDSFQFSPFDHFPSRESLSLLLLLSIFFSREHLDHSPAYRMITRQQIIDKLCAEQHWQSQCCFRTEQLSEQLSFLPRVSCHSDKVGWFLPDGIYLEAKKKKNS